MLYLAVIVVATGFLCFGGYKLGMRSDVWPIVLSLLLLLAAWRLLLDFNITPGEGAAIGGVVVQAGIWYLGVVFVLLALILLGTSFYFRRSLAVAGVLIFLVAPAVLTLGYRLATSRRAAPGTRGEPAQDTVPSYATDLEGYNWALDNGIQSEAECVDGSRAFIDGCKRAARHYH